MESKNMKELIAEIREATKTQKSASRVDEIRLMREMINDPDFVVSVYHKNRGFIGTRCPREEAVKFIANTANAITGLDAKTCNELANAYQFTRRDAVFLLDNAKDFVNTYIGTGRKLPIVQGEDTEGDLYLRPTPARTKVVPTADGNKQANTIPAYQKVVCKSRNPKYHV